MKGGSRGKRGRGGVLGGRDFVCPESDYLRDEWVAFVTDWAGVNRREGSGAGRQRRPVPGDEGAA